MSIEVEIKLRISDKKCIEETLGEIGFCKEKFAMESDIETKKLLQHSS